ncbi:hypothetical protein FPZ24_14715 [Sphingomonas panacisoli]|uniref:DUF4350 domain-containing protein n=1 Tax=Sphingomonas panacisoli TaxID=1813879 RepID=A0A5B8LJZ0_9SPHN|nr:DUF4350 domain-containing protein [Sphingomonas panacisoli]QDZ08567.1 hypothetical protein FPZ24_14715 [Sphingomonas panacisoli]
MSDVAISRSGAEAPGLFSLRMIIILVAVGVAAFAAMVIGAAYAPGSTPKGGGAAHAVSNSAVGYSGIIQLAQASGYNVRVVRDQDQLDSRGLTILTPQTADTPMGDLITRRSRLPTLIVLPKWQTVEDKSHPGWVKHLGLLPPGEPYGVLAPDYKLTVTRTKSGGAPLTTTGWLADSAIRIAAPRPLQTISGANLRPLLTDEAGRIVLGQIGDGPLYVLADGDLLANVGMRNAANASAALDLLDQLNVASEPMSFDVTLVGLGRSPNALRLAFDPPFLAMTLTLVAAMLLAGWQAFVRFGPPVRRERAIAFGKAALVDNSAALIRKARRQARLGGRYVEVIRDRAVIAFGVPSKLRDKGVDDYLDKMGGRAKFSDLAAAADAASDRAGLVAAAQALHDWQKEKGK